MIKIENIKVYNIARAVYSSRNAMNSWDKSDSDLDHDVLGENDIELARKLYKAGSEHRKYLRQIFVKMDVTAPLYWWKEMDQYRINVTTSSCSTMHKLLDKPFEMEDFSFDKLPGYKNIIKQFVPEVSEEMVAKERWIPFCDGEYEVSQYGRIKHNFKEHYRLLGGSKHQDGYVFVTIHGAQTPLHRIVAKAFHAESYEEGMVVNHIDGNKQNNFASNLEWVTQKENIRHSRENNLQPKAVKKYKGKFSAEIRDEIKRLWEDGKMSKREIARRYGVAHTTVCSIINDKYKYADSVNLFEEVARPWVDTLNELRDSWFEAEDEASKKRIWYSIVQLLPSSYNQRRTITMNYENVMSMINQREGHKLDEWREMVETLRTLPYVKEIRGEE